MFNDPKELIRQLYGGDFNFEESPGYKFQLEQAMEQSNNAAAAGGMLGSPAAQASAAKQAQGFAAQDYQNSWQRYMDEIRNLLGVHQGGLAGTQGLQNQGFQASGEMANNMAQIQAAIAKAQGQQAEAEQSQNSGLGSLIGGGLGMAFGGPAGAGIGSSLGGMFL